MSLRWWRLVRAFIVILCHVNYDMYIYPNVLQTLANSFNMSVEDLDLDDMALSR